MKTERLIAERDAALARAEKAEAERDRNDQLARSCYRNLIAARSDCRAAVARAERAEMSLRAFRRAEIPAEKWERAYRDVTDMARAAQ